MARSLDRDGKKEVVVDLVSSIFLLLYLGVVATLVFNFLTNGGALENPANVEKFWTYAILGLIASFLMFIAKLENFITVFLNAGKSLNKRTREILDAFDVFIHQPRYSVVQEFSPKAWWLNPFDLTLIFSIMGLLIGFSGIIFEPLRERIFSFLFEQQISPTAEFGLAIEPASFGETMFLMLLIGIIWGISKYLVNKGVYNKTTHYLLTIIILPIFGGFFWNGLHYVVYGASSQAQIVTFFYGWIQSFTAMIFVSVIPAYLLHAIQNGFVKAQEMFADEIIIIVVFFIMIILAVILAIRVSLFAQKND